MQLIVSLFVVMICFALVRQRLFALSKASGQKAAQYVLHRYPQNFTNDPADPQIEVCSLFIHGSSAFVVFVCCIDILQR